MKPNMGNLDRMVRVIIALAIALAWYTDMISGTAALIGLAFAGIFIATSLVSFCPLYLPFGLDTLRKRKAKA